MKPYRLLDNMDLGMNYNLLSMAFAMACSSTYALDGQIVDKQGQPIAGAKVNSIGEKTHVLSDKNGHFQVAEDAGEIHITAPGYSHRVIHLHPHSSTPLIIPLASTAIEQVDVIGLPIHASTIESAMPIAVLSGEDLRNQQASTLGDTLERQVGVNTNFYGNVASTPIIRGLSGPRVLITQNSLDVSDVSRVGPDHSVSSEVSTSQQVEILRGPATLFYGSGAIGGVVNVVDNRVPTDSETTGEFFLSRETVNEQNQASFNGTTGTDEFAFYADGFWRESDDYEVPVPADQDEHENADIGNFTVANSGDESNGYTLGSSYLLDNGYVGISVGRLNRDYGIPGHTHAEEEHLDEEESVYASLNQDRYQLSSELDVNLAWLRTINTRAAYTDYTHAEIEDGTIGTRFSNKTTEVRIDLLHPELAHWKGGLNLHYKASEVTAEGEEAFTPPSNSRTLAMALMEERHFGDVLIQLGARVERVTITANNVLLPNIEVHHHDDEEQAHEEHDTDAIQVFAVNHKFTPASLSVGAVWDFAQGYNVGVSLSHSQRAPSASELLSFGPHIGTGAYEIGALFTTHEDNNETHFEIMDDALELETANNIDVTLRKHEGNVGFIFNIFLNQISDYYYQTATGLYAEGGHDHADEDHDPDHDLPVYLFTHEDATLYGYEMQGMLRINDHWKTSAFSDYVHAELDNGTYLPRTPPLRFGADLDYTGQKLSANMTWTHYADQDKVATLESPTDGYDLLDATLTYHFPLNGFDFAVFIKGENLTDTEARVHTSFVKDIAPRPGRNFSLGIRGTF